MDKTGISPGLLALLVGRLDPESKGDTHENMPPIEKEVEREPRQGSTPQERAQEALL
jgi:hypothetical protein